MSDKTCGTCVNYVPFPLRRGEGLCFMTIDDDFPMFMRSDNACDGGVYSERPDSLEAVALDAYDLVKRAINALAMTTIGVEATDAAVIDLMQDETAICSRLEDLGVKQKWSLS
ncbi:hypothetical protein CE91St30_02650 [Raoultibacter timonensis]|uniref:Uncharacterized protein n=2 Tax=Raoultibacter timonensis TaxID=1907662 RepID=A0ABN6MDU7_9ACTN|nr:hypothetical protein CE91St30_02650 [Raoultibacter timonensis]BDF49535.1 hypothetical protein CE91St31_02650 [Raoultibacter timonensis]